MDYGGSTPQAPGAAGAYPPVDRAVDGALHDALAVYYFPGMWDWQPAIVLPLVNQAFDRSVREQRAGSELTTAEQESIRRGRLLLERYAVWAPSVDRFAPVRVDCDVDVQVPDPRFPGQAVTVGEAGSAGAEVGGAVGGPAVGGPAVGGPAVGGPAVGGAVRYQDRVDLVVIDEHNTYWVVSHRVVRGGWPDTGQLLLDEQCVAWCWAWEMSYPGMRVAGTIYNELHIDALAGPPAAPGQPSPGAAAGPRSAVTQHREAYAPPTPPRHPPPGTPEPVEEGRLGGSSWSMGRGAAPPRFSRGGRRGRRRPPPGRG
jgi:hypothetical protein